MIDLSDNDIINQYYSPKENSIKKIFAKLCKQRSDVLISYIDVADKTQFESDSNHFIVTDQMVDTNKYPSKKILKLPDSVFGTYYISEQLENSSISKEFNLFSNRANVQRQFWFYKIIENGWLDRCVTSYIGSTSRSSQPDLNPQQFVDYLHKNFFFPMYETEYQFARENVPYQNFVESGDLRKIMIKTKLSIVIETYHERSDAITFSEKIFRALQVPRPWVLSGATGSVSRLRSMGFDVFDDYIDHSYDSYPTDQDIAQRDSNIMNQVERVMNLTVTKSIQDDWYQRYQNNCKILALWNQTWRKDFQQFILDNFPDVQINFDDDYWNKKY